MIGGIGSGKMDRRITIQKKVTTRDATYGQPTYDFEDVGTFWAELKAPPLNRSSEQEQGNKIITRRLATYIIRYSSTASVVTERMRILDGAETYEINDVAIRKREGYIQLGGTYTGVAT